jgi:hypothetical protein
VFQRAKPRHSLPSALRLNSNFTVLRVPSRLTELSLERWMELQSLFKSSASAGSMHRI